MWCEEVRDNVVGREKGFTYIYIYMITMKIHIF